MRERETYVSAKEFAANVARTLEDLTPTSRKRTRAAWSLRAREGNRIQWDAIVIYSPRCDWPPCRTAHVAPIIYIYKIGTASPNRTAVCVVLGINEERVASLCNPERNAPLFHKQVRGRD